MVDYKQEASVSKAALPDWAITDPTQEVTPNTPQTRTSKNNMALRNFVHLLEKIGEDAGQSDLAWKSGQTTDYTTRGKIGRAVLGAKTLGCGFRRLCEFFPLLQDATDLRLDVTGPWASLSYKILDPDIWPRTQDALYSLGIYSSLLRAAAPDAWGQVDVTVEAKSDQFQQDLCSMVQAKVFYSGDSNGLRFPTALLDCGLNLTPSVSTSQLQDLNRQLVLRRRKMLFSERVRQLIFRDLGEKSLNQELIASELGVCSRTLRRKLTAEGLSFQELLDDCRMRAAALDFRTKRTLSLSELALRLGYSEHSTFSRAFARWAGVSPQEYRASTHH